MRHLSFHVGMQDLELPPPATLECIAEASPVGGTTDKGEGPAVASSSAHVSSAATAETRQTSATSSPASVPAAAAGTEKASGTGIAASKEEDSFAVATSIAVGASPAAEGPAAATAAATADVGELPQLVDEQQAIPRGDQDDTCGDATGSIGADDDAAVRSTAVELSEQRQQAAAEGKVGSFDPETDRSTSQTISVAG